MSPQDHNKTLVILHSSIGAFFTLGLIGAPWIIGKNFRHSEQVPTAILVFGIVFLLALLYWCATIAMYRRKPLGRKLALIGAVAPFPIIGAVGIYSWWFMHSDGAKQMYGVKRE